MKHEISVVIIWQNVKKAMPKKHQWVLVATPHCTYKYCAAKWSGMFWIDSDGAQIQNVQYWTEVETPTE